MQGFIIGEPSNPFSNEVISAAKKAVESSVDIIEAHMPQLFIPNDMEEPEQVLIIGFDKEIDIESLISEVSTKFNSNLKEGPDLLIIPVHINDDFLNSVREAKCEIYNPYNTQQKKKWLKSW